MFKYVADEVCLSDNGTVYDHDCKKNMRGTQKLIWEDMFYNVLCKGWALWDKIKYEWNMLETLKKLKIIN